MKAMMLTTVGVCGLLLAAVGCKHADQAIVTGPSPIELPAANRDIPTISPLIGIDGQGYARKMLPLPRFPEIKPTASEREVLGDEPEEPELDELVLYRPPRGAEHGVGRTLYGVYAGVSGSGGASVGHENAYRSYGVTWDQGGVYSELLPAPTRIAHQGRARRPGGHPGPRWRIDAAEGLPRSRCARAPHYDR